MLATFIVSLLVVALTGLKRQSATRDKQLEIGIIIDNDEISHRNNTTVESVVLSNNTLLCANVTKLLKEIASPKQTQTKWNPKYCFLNTL